MPHRNCESRQQDPRHCGLFLGGSLIIFGTSFLLDRLGLLQGMNPWHIWPTILIWAGLLNVVSARHRGRVVWGLVLLLGGATVQAHYLDLLPMELGNLWPIGLVALGSIIIVGSVAGRRRLVVQPQTNSDSTFSRNLSFSGREERITTQVFQGGTIACTFGGLKLNMSGAEIEGDEAVLDLDLMMGGLELKVPRHWRVVVEASPMLGGVEDRSSLDELATVHKKLVLRGRIFMGGVEIRN